MLRVLMWFLALFVVSLQEKGVADAPNILVITVDDMSCDSVGVFGCPVPETTPHIDRLASQSLRFEYAHVQVGNCMPSRNVMWSGRYPHTNGVEGFFQVRQPGHPMISDLLEEAGYFTAIRGKVTHSTPYHPYPWNADVTIIRGEQQHVKDIRSYGRSTSAALEQAAESDQPFFLMVNISDPHKPFYAPNGKESAIDRLNRPSKTWSPEEITVPGFLPDCPPVRNELVDYYNSVRRADDCVGEILTALDQSGMAEETFVLFLSDHGMPLPFAKTGLWHHSTRTPLMVRWPGHVAPGTIDRRHMVSAIDFVPTLLDLTGQPHPDGLQGRSFLPLLKGEHQSDRDYVIKEYHENSGGHQNPMRAIQTREYLYLFNPWADGERRFRTATQGTASYRAMQDLSLKNLDLAARLRLFDHRVVEELYVITDDPDCLQNRIDDPALKDVADTLAAELAAWMVETGDPALGALHARENPQVLDEWMRRDEAAAAARKADTRKKAGPNPKPLKNAIRFDIPKQWHDSPMPVAIEYRLPKSLGDQQLHVTLKDAQGKRIERQVVTIRESGRAEILFTLPDNYRQDSVRLAAFLGLDYNRNLQHIATAPIPIR